MRGLRRTLEELAAPLVDDPELVLGGVVEDLASGSPSVQPRARRDGRPGVGASFPTGLNIADNCLDRHLSTAGAPAHIMEG